LAVLDVNVIDTRCILFFSSKNTQYRVRSRRPIVDLLYVHIVVHCAAVYSFHPIHIFFELFNVQLMLFFLECFGNRVIIKALAYFTSAIGFPIPLLVKHIAGSTGTNPSSQESHRSDE